MEVTREEFEELQKAVLDLGKMVFSLGDIMKDQAEALVILTEALREKENNNE